jgi:hypothetical protein
LDTAASENGRRATRDAAAAFLEDFDHMRSAFARESVTRPEARAFSGILRRLLLDNDLITIANPRTGRVLIEASDFSAAYIGTATNKKVVAFYGLDTKLHGMPIHTIVGGETMPNYIEKKGQFPVDRFVGQKTIYFEQTWVTRRDMIRYVANQKSGVHSDNERRLLPELRGILAKLETAMTVSIEDGLPTVKFLKAPSETPSSTYRRDTLNPVLLSIISTANSLISAPNVVALADYVRAELG